MMSGMTVAQLIAAVQQIKPSPVINYADSALITLRRGNLNVKLEPDPMEDMPTVSLADRLADILGLSVDPDRRLSYLTYRYRAGYEEARCSNNGISFSGAYHPTVVCEGRGMCVWCGRTLMYT